MGDENGQDDEKPVHEVWVEAFWIGTYPVTNRDFQQFRAFETPRSPLEPVTHVSWYDSAAYCEWLSEESGRHYRLPTEAEWEYAARSGSQENTYPWGKHKIAVDSYFETGPAPVGTFDANEFGIYDMGLNVHEWCSDWYDADYYKNSPTKNPQGPATGKRRSSRGGSWRHQIKITRCAARSSIPPDFKYADYGFRVVRNVD